VKAKLDRSSGGIFDVVVDGDLVFSKFETGRFPNEGEVLEMIARRKG